jgi:hypothetical protein
MSAITQERWLSYVTPSVGGRPTTKMSSPGRSRRPPLSVPAKDPRLFAPHAAIDRVASMRANWDSHGSRRPIPSAVERARQFLEEAFRAVHRTAGWEAPHVSASEDGEIVFEWWNGSRKLTIYIGPEHSTFLKSWGPHIIDDMVDGALTQNWDPELWTWLFE